MTDEGLESLGPEEERRLRLALRMIGEEAGRAEPEPTAPPRRRRAVWAGALVLATALALGVLTVVSMDGGGDTEGSSDMADGSARGLREHEWIACSATIVEGDVLDVRPAAEPDRELVTLEVGEWIKPTEGSAELELNLVDQQWAQVQEPLREGEHVLIVVSVLPDEVPDVFRGDRLGRYRDIIDEALPRAENTECPDFWLNKDDQPAP